MPPADTRERVVETANLSVTSVDSEPNRARRPRSSGVDDRSGFAPLVTNATLRPSRPAWPRYPRSGSGNQRAVSLPGRLSGGSDDGADSRPQHPRSAGTSDGIDEISSTASDPDLALVEAVLERGRTMINSSTSTSELVSPSPGKIDA